MVKYITYDIRCLENIKLSTTHNQIDFEESLDYISGSSIRGAFIYNYINQFGIDDISNSPHKEKFFSDNIIFFNAYPKVNNKRSFPLPKCFFAPKSEMKIATDYLNVELGVDNELKPLYEKVRVCEFVIENGNTLNKVKVEKESHLHINKNTPKNKLYRYETIKKDQVFSGIIMTSDDYENEVVRILNESTFYIGGSKGSGYGRCKIENFKVLDENPEFTLSNIKESKDFYVIALSDIIYRNDHGKYTTTLDGHALGYENAKFVDSNIETKYISTYNNKWRQKTPNTVAIKAGSVFKFHVDETVDTKKLTEIMTYGIGEKKNEGFGRIAIVDEIKYKTIKLNAYNDTSDLMSETIYAKDNQFLKTIGLEIFKNRVNKKINREVLELNKNIKPNDWTKLKPSQIGNLMTLINSLIILDPTTGKQKFADYIIHLTSKTNNPLYKALFSIVTKDENKNMLVFLDNYLKDSDNKEKFKDKFKDCAINSRDFPDFFNEIDDEFVYTTNLKILSELFRYRLRIEEVNKLNENHIYNKSKDN